MGHSVDQAHFVGSLGRDVAPAEDDHERLEQARLAPARVQQPRQTLRAAVAGQQPQVDLGLAELGGQIGDAVVAGERELHAAAERHAVDDRDARLVHRLDLAERKVRVVRQRDRVLDRVDLLEELADVGAGDEALGVPGR